MTRNFAIPTFFLSFAVIAIGALSLTADEHKHEKGEVHEHSHDHVGARVFEQRVYTTADGKLPNLHARFRNHTNYLFVKHGMQLIGYWTPTEKENTLVYILAYPSQEAREKSWKGFMNDPVWKKVWAESKENAGGTIVTNVESTYMTPTDYSPIH